MLFSLFSLSFWEVETSQRQNWKRKRDRIRKESKVLWRTHASIETTPTRRNVSSSVYWHLCKNKSYAEINLNLWLILSWDSHHFRDSNFSSTTVCVCTMFLFMIHEITWKSFRFFFSFHLQKALIYSRIHLLNFKWMELHHRHRTIFFLNLNMK